MYTISAHVIEGFNTSRILHDTRESARIEAITRVAIDPAYTGAQCIVEFRMYGSFEFAYIDGVQTPYFIEPHAGGFCVDIEP